MKIEIIIINFIFTHLLKQDFKMEFKLENLNYQDIAIQSVVKIFDGTDKNNFDNSCFEGIRSNSTKLSNLDIENNIKSVLLENGINDEIARLSNERDICVEMETGTGKTLVYIKTIYELYKEYGFTKFIILVPSVAIRQNIIGTFKAFEKQLENIYGFKPDAFEYDSKKLQKVSQFIEEQYPQVMIMTLASFNSEDKILNQAQREDLFNNIPFIEAIGKTNPIIIMDEPQEGMDTDNSITQIAKLNPLYKIRYSATHKVVKNLIYRLTPYDSYKEGLVKKIEVLTVTEKNDEATLKIELADIQFGKGDPKIKLKAWHLSKTSNKIEFKTTGWLSNGDNLGDKTNNPSYLNYTISNINKSLKTGNWSVTFSNGAEILEKQISGTLENIWALQIEWLIHRHFTKSQKLAPKEIKCLSLVFIDRVANYIGETPLIKNLFVEKYRAIYPEYHNGNSATVEHIQSVQGYYFAQKSSGEFADNEGGVKEQAKIYELILKGKEELLTLSNPVQFVFSHSALGVGWDNPNVFNIATLNNSYSETKKRQEIGRGLRICVNQKGQRVYDAIDVDDSERINQLTVIPNETYETQYQEEIKSVYGTANAGAGMTNNHKGIQTDEVKFKRNTNDSIDKAFRKYWTALAKKTEYTVNFHEERLINGAVEEINKITIPDFVIEASSFLIDSINEEGKQDTFQGSENVKQKTNFTPLDLIEELSENTGLSYASMFKIFEQLTNLREVIKNPPRFIHEASTIVRNAELDEMIRGLNYELTGESFPFEFNDFVKNIDNKGYVATPNKGVFDKMLIDSDVEKKFSLDADKDVEVVCFLKLPSWYKIKTPIGDYEPDFGLIMKRKNLKDRNENEFYFVIETKGTNDINDKKALKESEIYKIRCAIKHFEKLGLEVQYKAPVKEYSYFKTEADKTINSIV